MNTDYKLCVVTVFISLFIFTFQIDDEGKEDMLNVKHDQNKSNNSILTSWLKAKCMHDSCWCSLY